MIEPWKPGLSIGRMELQFISALELVFIELLLHVL